jgi:hypothetical protein
VNQSFDVGLDAVGGVSSVRLATLREAQHVPISALSLIEPVGLPSKKAILIVEFAPRPPAGRRLRVRRVAHTKAD